MTTAVNAVASSSKRAASPSPSAHPAKRARPSASSAKADIDNDDDDDDDEGPAPANMTDEEMKARAARKEARTIRNRESAQRSRNQRKAHLAYLETRVLELEAENRTLKAGSSSPTPSSTTTAADPQRETSPAQSVMSLANDLGIPTELVSGNGVNLANVAPPPADMATVMEDVKPVIAKSPTPSRIVADDVKPETPLEMLKRENAALRERVSLLENLVKQVVAVANLSGLDTPTSTRQTTDVTDISSTDHTAAEAQIIDWSTFITSSDQLPAPGLDVTLSPSLYTNSIAPTGTYDYIPSSAASATSYTNASTIIETDSNKLNPVARHPAAGEGDLSFFGFVIGDGIVGAGAGPGALGDGSQSGGSAGQAQGLAGGFDMAMSQRSEQASGESELAYEQVWAQGGQKVESWDEAMRSLIEDLEGGEAMGGGAAGVRATVMEDGRDTKMDNGMGLGLEWYGPSVVV